MEVFLSELHFALRRLLKSPSFTVVSVLTLGLGQGAATALFSVVYGVLLQPLPYPEAGHIVRVFEVAEDGRRPTRMSDPNFSDLQQQSRSFTDLVQQPQVPVSFWKPPPFARFWTLTAGSPPGLATS